MVQFRLADVHLPAIEDVLSRMTEETELQGTVTLLSNKGGQETSFVVVEVKGILSPIIVPASSIHAVQGVEGSVNGKSWSVPTDTRQVSQVLSLPPQAGAPYGR
jgi:hypothetical protein